MRGERPEPGQKSDVPMLALMGALVLLGAGLILWRMMPASSTRSQHAEAPSRPSPQNGAVRPAPAPGSPAKRMADAGKPSQPPPPASPPLEAVKLAEDTGASAKRLADAAIYLGCGGVEGPGEVIQLDQTGEVLGTVRLSGAPYGLAAHKDGLVAAVPTYGGPGELVRIDGQGRIETVLKDGRVIPNPIAVAADPGSGDILVADNQTDVLLLLPGGRSKDMREPVPVGDSRAQMQNMSVAFARDGWLLFGGSGPSGVYRFRAGQTAGLGPALLAGCGTVAADPSSGRWVAALAGELVVFEAGRELARFQYPVKGPLRYITVAFGPGGILVMGLHRPAPAACDLVAVDIEAKAFRRLFSHGKSTVKSLAVGPKADWSPAPADAKKPPGKERKAPAEEQPAPASPPGD